MARDAQERKQGRLAPPPDPDVVPILHAQGREYPQTSPLMSRFFTYRQFLEKGVLPRAGGLDDQHPLYVAAMSVLLDEEARFLKERQPK